MSVQNPLLRGMYPDPSVCCVDGTYYLVNSSFEYLPAVPVFRSRDLVNWEQIGHVLTRPSQIDLSGTKPSDGIFAPTIRWHDGRFYMVTTCATPRGFKNFFVTAQDPAGPWSDPVFVDVMGIDPSLFWEDGRTYMHYAGKGEILQVEIDEATGAVLDGPRLLTYGTGGRDTEGPHMWVRDGWHYLLLAEGGTREGHMVTLMRGHSVWGPFEPSLYGPVVTNRELPREPIQRTGHSDWVVGLDGRDYLLALGVREVKHRNLLGRETSLCPVDWTEDGWLRAAGGRLPVSVEDVPNTQRADWSFALDMSAAELPLRVIWPRVDLSGCYRFEAGALKVRGNGHGLDDGDSAVWMVRQPEFDVRARVVLSDVELASEADEAGVVALVSNDHHLSAFVTLRAGRRVLVVRRRVGDIDDQRVFALADGPVELVMEGSAQQYRFVVNGEPVASALAKHVSCEVAGTQNTGVMDGVFVSGEAAARVTAFEVVA